MNRVILVAVVLVCATALAIAWMVTSSSSEGDQGDCAPAAYFNGDC